MRRCRNGCSRRFIEQYDFRVAYIRAAVAGLLVSLILRAILGVLTGVSIAGQLRAHPAASNHAMVHGPLGAMGPYDGSILAASWAAGVATALNCGAFFAIFLVPVALGVVVVKRRLAR